MANNYSEFSEMFQVEESEYLIAEEVVDLFYFLCEEYDKCEEELMDSEHADKFKRAREVFDLPEWPTEECPDPENWEEEWFYSTPEVELEKEGVWIHSDGCMTESVVLFVQALQRALKTDEPFVITGADMCSKPRLSEFGGWCLVIWPDKVLGGGSWPLSEYMIKHGSDPLYDADRFRKSLMRLYAEMYGVDAGGVLRYDPDKEWDSQTLTEIDQVVGGLFTPEEVEKYWAES